MELIVCMMVKEIGEEEPAAFSKIATSDEEAKRHLVDWVTEDGDEDDAKTILAHHPDIDASDFALQLSAGSDHRWFYVEGHQMP